MEKHEMLSMLEVIDQQVSSSILGGMEEQYGELERLGYVTIDRSSVQHSASITPEGLEFLHHPYTGGTGSNRTVATEGTVIVRMTLKTGCQTNLVAWEWIWTEPIRAPHRIQWTGDRCFKKPRLNLRRILWIHSSQKHSPGIN